MSTPRVEELADPLDGKYKGPNYKKGGFRERCLRRVWKWVAAVLIIVILAGVIAAVIRSGKKVRTCGTFVYKSVELTFLLGDDDVVIASNRHTCAASGWCITRGSSK